MGRHLRHLFFPGMERLRLHPGDARQLEDLVRLRLLRLLRLRLRLLRLPHLGSPGELGLVRLRLLRLPLPWMLRPQKQSLRSGRST